MLNEGGRHGGGKVHDAGHHGGGQTSTRSGQGGQGGTGSTDHHQRDAREKHLNNNYGKSRPDTTGSSGRHGGGSISNR